MSEAEVPSAIQPPEPGRAVLVLAESAEDGDRLTRDLNRGGMRVIGAAQCGDLVREATRLQPDAVVGLLPTPDAGLFEAARALQTFAPVAVAVFTRDARAESIDLAVASGIHAWIVQGYEAERLRAVVHLAQARQRRDLAQRAEIASLALRLEERKSIDRAKGILMGVGGISEDEAFQSLRSAAMQGKQRLGQVAQRLIEAAREAEAVNRAGQLRMLSQRLVKLQALAALSVDPAGTQVLLASSAGRAKQNLALLARMLSGATFGDLIGAATAAWREVEAALEAGDAVPLDALDAAAERLLDAAERLTGALEAASPAARGHVINLAGRQRMLSQRVAKLALRGAVERQRDSRLRAQDIDPRERVTDLRDPAGAVRRAQDRAARAAFIDAQRELARSPLTDDAGRAGLARAGLAWETLCANCSNPVDASGALAIAQASEELLERFDALILGYGHNLKVLVG